ncbi:MAG TPA: hypothetical protein VE978_14230 [Chitinophagales bacterium]|nr:hypothetical protein [Chitinophagales bacterium]
MRQIQTLILSIILLTTQISEGQKKCSFQIDTAKILANRNLDSFIADLKSDNFDITNNKKNIPKFIKRQLDCFTGNFRIANPDEPYNSTDIIIRSMPGRQLVFLAQSNDLLVMQYLEGGYVRTSHLLLVKFKDSKIVDLWKGICFHDISTIQDVTGYLELNRNKEWGLNTNIIYF